MAKTYDLFICHSSQDKATFVEQLVAALVSTHGLRVWYDRLEIKPGDDIRKAIEDGIGASDFGAVVLSPHFWTTWTNDEVRYLEAHEDKTGDGRAVLVPVMLGMNPEDLKARSPRLSERDAILGDQGAVIAAQALADHVRNVRPRPKTVSPTYNLARRPVTNFVGRDAKLAEVIRALTTGNVSISASIEGLAGIGKTEFAVNVATQLAGTAHFPGGIYWLDAEQGDLADAWGGPIADRLDIPLGPVAERCRRTLNRLASMQPARLLVILDNVSSWADDVQPGPLPQGPHVAILATSRLLKLGGQAFTHVDLDVLDLVAARSLLLGLAPARMDEAGVEELLAHLNGHALALELAGAYLARYPSTTAAGYLRRLKAGDPVEDKVAKDARYQRTVKAALEATVAMLDEAGRKALLVCGQFADADASVALLRACRVDEDAERALRDLHLVRSDGERWGMHRLVRQHSRGLAGADSLELRSLVWSGCASELPSGPAGARAYYKERPHYDHIANGALAGEYRQPTAMKILERIGAAAMAAGMSAAAERYLAAHSQLTRKTADDQRKAFADVKLEYIRPDGSTVPGPDPFLTSRLLDARSVVQMAWALVQGGKYGQAADALTPVMAFLQQHLPPHDPDCAVAAEATINALLGLGRRREAEERARDLLAACVAAYGERSLQVARARMTVSLTLGSRDGQAARQLQRAMEAISEQQGQDVDALRAQLMASLAYRYDRAGDLAGARSELARAIALVRSVSSLESAELLAMTANAVALAVKDRDLVSARDGLAALAPRRATLDPRSPVALLLSGAEATLLSYEAKHDGALRMAETLWKMAAHLPPQNEFRAGIADTVAKVRKAAKKAGRRSM